MYICTYNISSKQREHEYDRACPEYDFIFYFLFSLLIRVLDRATIEAMLWVLQYKLIPS